MVGGLNPLAPTSGPTADRQTIAVANDTTVRRGSKCCQLLCSASAAVCVHHAVSAHSSIGCSPPYTDPASTTLEGARITTGGARSPRFEEGFFVEPTVFAGVTADMTIAREEIFGPVASIIAYDDVDQAVALANDTDFGLSGTVFTGDVERGYAMARRIRTGNVSVNGLEMAPNVPFGGFKQSGIGREGGPEGLHAFLEDQAIYLPAGSPRARQE
ncbi:aldehyde dehydrogenase family protein [Paraburkholderia sp. SIMBA_055]|uniref:aldehyde dehydrogenase family protein n=1 Tax=Paraburkholderia graminis TaxID=60548 RepID=UPI0027D8F24F|nr:aldehyde dehydrogenase family protein [Paraburkholderia graminis]